MKQEQLDLAVKQHQAGQLDLAEATYRNILAKHPQSARAMYLLGTLLSQRGQAEAAVDLIRGAIAIEEPQPEYHRNLGVILAALKRPAEARIALRRAVELKSDWAEAWFDLAGIARSLNLLDEAVEAFGQSVRHRFDVAQSWNDFGVALAAVGQYQRAAEALRRAVRLAPNDPTPFCNLGLALWYASEFTESIAMSSRAIELKPDSSQAWMNLGLVYLLCFRQRESVDAMRRSVSLSPEPHSVHSNLLYAMRFLPDRNLDQIFQEHLLWDRLYAQPLRSRIEPHCNGPDPQRVLRIGYVSADFREHAVSFFMESLLTHHDPAQVEVYCYSSSGRPEDATTQRIKGLVKAWEKITFLDDDAAAEMIRADGIDILVDLTGHTGENRMLIFARRPAPIQASYLGYSDTTGLSTMDYRLTDSHVDPPGSERRYTESLVRLPRTLACFRPSSPVPDVAPLPALAHGYVTFGSFNALSKINAPLLECWATILQRIPKSRLQMVARGLHEVETQSRMLAIFNRFGIGPERITLTGQHAPDKYLLVHNYVDIILDSFPVNGHTVTCHALWMGVPVLTLAGESFGERLGTSVMTNLNLTDWIARTPDEYITKAVEKAGDLPALAQLRASLRQRMLESPLLDAPALARDIEAKFRTMWIKWCAEPR